MGYSNPDKPVRKSGRVWTSDSKSFGVGGKMRQTSARRLRCPNKSASGNHIGPNDPHHKALDNSLVQKLGSSKI